MIQHSINHVQEVWPSTQSITTFVSPAIPLCVEGSHCAEDLLQVQEDEHEQRPDLPAARPGEGAGGRQYHATRQHPTTQPHQREAAHTCPVHVPTCPVSTRTSAYVPTCPRAHMPTCHAIHCNSVDSRTGIFSKGQKSRDTVLVFAC